MRQFILLKQKDQLLQSLNEFDSEHFDYNWFNDDQLEFKSSPVDEPIVKETLLEIGGLRALISALLTIHAIHDCVNKFSNKCRNLYFTVD